MEWKHEFKGLFMTYDSWFKHHELDPKHYKSSTARMLYHDRWIVLIPLLIVIVAIMGLFVILN